MKFAAEALRDRRWLLAVVAIVAVTVTLLVMAPRVFADTTTSENIKLVAQPGSLDEDASGQVQLYIFNDPDPNIVFDAQITNLETLRYQFPNAFYALYVTTETHGRERVFSFNTNGGGYQGNGERIAFTAVIPGSAEVYRTEDVTVEVWAELDDGIDSPDWYSPFLKVLEGTLER